jgi:hypothetical protein
VYEFVITENGEHHPCVLTADSKAGFELLINGKDKLTVADSFTLFDEVLNTKVNNNDLTLQLISRNPNGEVNLQYLGTKVYLFG